MKIITADTGFLIFRKLFQQLLSSQSPVVVWQNNAESGGKLRSYCALNAFHFESKRLYFSPIDGEITPFDMNEAFFYSEQGQIIFKSRINALEQNICLDMPDELKILDEEEVTIVQENSGIDLNAAWKVKRLEVNMNPDGSDIMRVKTLAERSGNDQQILNDELIAISLDEEDKLFQDKRESPRARPKKQKYVTIQNAIGETRRFPLFDLSQGGMGFVIMDESLFTKGSVIYVYAIDAKVLDDPLIGTVMSSRTLGDNNIGFKIGVKFEEGQE